MRLDATVDDAEDMMASKFLGSPKTCIRSPGANPAGVR